jgi:predicted dehydrogenase
MAAQPQVHMGVIGVGQRGRHLVKLVQKTPGAKLTAITDNYEPSIELTKQFLPPDVRIYNDWTDLIADASVQAVIIATPNYLHAQMALAAIAAGKDILLEKPVALNLTDCEQIELALRDSKCILQVGLELRYSAVLRQMLTLINENAIGTPRLAWCHEFRQPFAQGKVGDWIHNPALSGGTLVEKSCHHLDLLTALMGTRPLQVTARGGRDVVYQNKPGMIDNAWVTIDYEDGRRACMGLSMFSKTHRLELGVLGETGTLIGDMRSSTITLQKENQPPDHIDLKVKTTADEPQGHAGSDPLQMTDFIETVMQRRVPKVTLQDGISSLRIALAAQESIDTGRVVALL